MAASPDQIFEKVRDVLCDALGVDEDEVEMNSTLMGDLGAESLDVLDIVFRLEKAFDIKIPKGELYPEDITNNPDYVVDGTVTSAGLAKIKETMPHADLAEFEKDPKVSRLPDLFTVQMIVKYVESKLAA